MTRSDDLAAEAAEERAGRERRTAIAAAFSEVVRSGDAPSSAAVARLVEKRIDGSTATLRDPGARSRAGATNHADSFTSGYMPMESNREDY